MKRMFAFLVLLLLAVPVLQIHAEVPGGGPPLVKPSMDIALFPDGSIGVAYGLYVLAG